MNFCESLAKHNHSVFIHMLIFLLLALGEFVHNTAFSLSASRWWRSTGQSFLNTSILQNFTLETGTLLFRSCEICLTISFSPCLWGGRGVIAEQTYTLYSHRNRFCRWIKGEKVWECVTIWEKYRRYYAMCLCRWLTTFTNAPPMVPQKSLCRPRCERTPQRRCVNAHIAC